MIIPAVPRFDDFDWDLLSYPAGERICPLGTSMLEGVEVHVLPGVTADRLKSAVFSIADTSLAASYLDPTAWQMLRIMPYGETGSVLYGFIANIQKHYGGQEEDGTSYNIIDVEVVGTEALLNSRQCYIYSGGEGLAIESASAYPDDFAKYMVRQTMVAGTCTADVDGNSRDWNWGTLVVAADASACPDAIELSVGEGLVGEAIQSLADKYGFAFELYPSFSAGAATFTFSTAYPSGVDRTVNNGAVAEVVLNDFIEAMIPEATYHRTTYPMVNALHGRSYAEVEIDATSIASWGRWEGASNSSGTAKIQTELSHLLDREGCTFVFSSKGANGAYQWPEDYRAGDIVTFSNNRLDVASRDETIAELTLRFPDKELEIEIRWGDKTPTYSDDNKNENLAPSHGGVTEPSLWVQYWERSSGTLRPVAHGDNVATLTSGDVETIRLTAATGYIRGARYEIGGATNYVGLSSANAILQAAAVAIISGTDVYLATGSVNRWAASDANFRPLADNSYTLGLTNRRPSTIFGVEGNFTGDVTIGTGKGIVHADGVTSGYILMANGTRYVPHTFAAADVPAHNVLSATHGDSLSDSVIAGDIIIGNATPKWARLAKGTEGKVLRMGAALPAWSTLTMADLSDGHAAVTLDVNVNAYMSLTAQELGMDTLTGNYVLASPAGSSGVMAPRYLAWQHVEEHKHNYDKATSTGDWTSSATVRGYITNLYKDGSGTAGQVLWKGVDDDPHNGTWGNIYMQTTTHIHNNAVYTWTYTSEKTGKAVSTA